MSRTRRFLSGVVVNYANQAVVAVCGLWVTWFILWCVGQADYGLWLIVIQMLAVLELLDLGVVSLIPREVAYVTGRHADAEARTAGVAEFLGKAARLLLWQMPLVALAGLAFWGAAGGYDARLDLPLGLIGLFYVVTFPLRIFQPALQGLQDLAFLGGASLAGWSIQTITTVALAVAGCGFWSLAAGWAANRCLLSLLCWRRLRRTFPGAFPRRLPALPFGEGKRLLASGMWVSTSRVAQVLLNGTELLILGKILGPAVVVVYVCTNKLVDVFDSQTYTLVTTAEPALSELKASASAGGVERAATALSQMMLLASGLIACVVLALNQGFVQWWVGPQRYGGLALTIVLAAVMVLRHLTFTLCHLLYCLGREKTLALVGLADGAVTVGATCVLVYPFGPLGAAYGSFLGVCLVSLPLNVYFLAKETGVSPASVLLRQAPWLWRFLCLALGCGAVGWAWPPAGLVALVVAGAAVCAAYALVMLPLALRSPLWTFLQPHHARVVRFFSRAA